MDELATSQTSLYSDSESDSESNDKGKKMLIVNNVACDIF